MKDTAIRPLILVSNDDGHEAAGIYALIDCMLELGDVIAVCPDGPRSGQSMAITVQGALRLMQLPDYHGAKMYKVNGTPVDCVKLAMHAAVDRKPDLVVAGINHGSNASVNVLYSGTMGAVMEGCLLGVDSIGFSLTSHAADADFRPSIPFVKSIASRVLSQGLPEGVCLNVNIPDSEVPPVEMRIVRECKGNWSDEYKNYLDPAGKPFYWLTGKFRNDEPEATDTDEWCLSHGIVSIVPVCPGRSKGISLPGWPEREIVVK